MCSTVSVMFGLKVPNRRKYIDFRPWRYGRCLTGPESLLSPDAGLVTSPTNESHRYVHDSELSWKSECVSPSSKLPLLRYHSHQQTLAARQREKDKLLARSALHVANAASLKADGSSTSSTTSPLSTSSSSRDLQERAIPNATSISNSGGCQTGGGPLAVSQLRENSNGVHLDRRMNVNGLDRSAMTGSSSTTSENLTWLAAVTSSQAQTGQRPIPGILSSLPPPVGPSSGGSSHHEHHPMLSGVQGSGLNSLFRPPLSLAADPGQRLFSTNQYAPIYTTTTTTLAPFSPTIYSGTSLSPYSAFYPHYPPGYNSALLPNYAHLDQSYSAALANMGSQVQHHVPQSQLSRTFLPGHLSQYPSLTPTNSPGQRSLTPSALSSSQGPGPHPLSDPHRQDTKSPHKSESRHSDLAPRRTLSPSRESKHSLLPGSLGVAHHSMMHPKHGQSIMKDPSLHDPKASMIAGKEGSRKHRILERTPDPDFIEPKHLPYKSSSLYPDEPSSKRSKVGIGLPPPLHPSHHPSSHYPPHHTSHHHHHHHPHHPHHHHHGAERLRAGSPGGHLRPPPPLHPAGYPPSSHLHYPAHFMRGSIIQLANGDLKRVEDLRTDDFVNSADVSGDLKIDSSTVVRIEENMERGTALLGFSVGEHRVQVTVEATLEHPFFVFGQGWSSCQPERTQHRYVLSCHKLSVGDVCISLTHKNVTSRPLESSSRQGAQQGTTAATSANQISGGTSASGAPTTHHTPLPTISSTSSSSSTVITSTSSSHKLPGEANITSQAVAETNIDVDTHSQDSPLPLVTADEGRAETPDSGTGGSRKRRWSVTDQASGEDSPSEPSTSHHAKDEESSHTDGGDGKKQAPGDIKEEPSPQA